MTISASNKAKSTPEKTEVKKNQRAELLTRNSSNTRKNDSERDGSQPPKKSSFTCVAMVFYKLNLLINIKFMFLISMLFSLELLKGAFANVPFMKTNSVFGSLSILIAVAIIGFYGYLIFFTGKKVARIVEIREKLKVWAKTQEDYQSGSEAEPLKSNSDKNLGKIQIYQSSKNKEEKEKEESSAEKTKKSLKTGKDEQEMKQIVVDEFSNEIQILKDELADLSDWVFLIDDLNPQLEAFWIFFF